MVQVVRMLGEWKWLSVVFSGGIRY